MSIESRVIDESINVANKLADRVVEVIKYYQNKDIEHKNDVVNADTVTPKLLIKYENIVKDMETLIQEYNHERLAPPHNRKEPSELVNYSLYTIYRLQKGYIKFVADTSFEKIDQWFAEELTENAIENELGITTENGENSTSTESLTSPI